MARIIHARIDDETDRLLDSLERRFGWTDSRAVREGIRALNCLFVAKPSRRIVGMGRFQSGIPDLGSNKAHLKGFGR